MGFGPVISLVSQLLVRWAGAASSILLQSKASSLVLLLKWNENKFIKCFVPKHMEGVEWICSCQHL